MSDKFNTIKNSVLYLIPIFGIIGIIIPLLLGKINLVLLGSYLSIPMLVATYYYKNSHNTIQYEYISDIRNFKIYLIIYSILLNISVIILYKYEVRPISYYFVIAAIATLILIEIITFEISKKKEQFILVQIILLMLDIIFGVTLKYQYYISRTDPLAHAWFLKNLIDYNFVNDVFGEYKPFPLWHILCASLYKITELSFPIHKIMFLTNGIVYASIIPITYLIATGVFKNKKIGMISALFTSINPSIITYGMASIPRSVVSFLEIILILLMFGNNSQRKEKKVLLIFFTAVIILYHTVSMPFILITLLIIHLAMNIFECNSKDYTLNINYLTLSLILTVTYWIYHAEALFEVLVTNIISPAPEGVLTQAIVYTPLTELFNYLQYSPLLFFIILGFLWTLDCKNCLPLAKIFCLIGLLSVVVSFPGPTLMLNKLAGNFALARFGEYTFIFICIVASVGFFKTYHSSKKNMKLLVITLFFIMSFLSVSNDFTASDDPLIKRPFYTSYLSEEEITAFNHLAGFTEGLLMSDYVTSRYLLYSDLKLKQHILEVDENHMDFIKNETSDVILIRDSELKKRPLKLYPAKEDTFELNPLWSTSLRYYYNDIILWNALNHYNKIYQSNKISGFT